MLDDMRKYVMGRFDAISPQGAEDLAATLTTMVQAAAEHLSGLASGLMDRSSEARATLVREIKELIRTQIEEMGLATKKDVATLRARLERLEAKGVGGASKSAPTRKTGARTAARPSGAPTRKTGARTAARTSSAPVARRPRPTPGRPSRAR